MLFKVLLPWVLILFLTLLPPQLLLSMQVIVRWDCYGKQTLLNVNQGLTPVVVMC